MEFLPIGSVVSLNGQEQKLMLTGRLQVADKDAQIYDYCGVLWPQGYQNASSQYLFNQSSISFVWFTGMQTEEEIEYRTRLNMVAGMPMLNGYS